MTGILKELEWQLERAPEDWSSRLRLIEEHILLDDLESAQKLVRTAPDEGPLPTELQHRLHGLMTRGKAAVQRS